MENKINFQTILMGFLHFLVAFTSITVVTSILGFNLPMAYLFAGVNTILFHIITKNKLPTILGVSGLYVGSILFVVKNYGASYAFGGIIIAGIIYIIFALISFKYQDKILKFFPDWLLSVVIILIGLGLLPTGKSLIASNLMVGLVAFGVTALVDIFGKKLSMLAMPCGVLAGTLVMLFTKGLTLTPLHKSLSMQMIHPQFGLASLTVAIVAFATIFEMLGDIKNTGEIIGKDVFKEVGIGRVALGNGVGTLLGGLFGANAYTTYAESVSFVQLSKYYNPWSQVIASILYIIIAFITPVSKLIMCLPTEAFGGCVIYLFSMIVVNGIKQLINSNINLNVDKRKFIIITIMIGIVSIDFLINGISFNSTAIATISGMLLNIIIPDNNKNKLRKEETGNETI